MHVASSLPYVFAMQALSLYIYVFCYNALWSSWAHKMSGLPFSSLYSWLISDSQVVPWASPEYRDLVLGTIIPTSFIFFAVFTAIVRAICIPLPKFVKRVLDAICGPFRNFLTPEEVMDTQCTAGVMTLIERTRALSIVALVASAGWIGCTVYGIVVKDIEYTFRALLAFMSWVCFF